MKPDELMSVKKYIRMLAKECPFFNSPSSDCVLNTLRLLSPTERDSRINAMTDTEVNIVVHKHLHCACQRDEMFRK